MIKEDRPAYKKLLKTITKGKNSELSYLLQDFDDVQRICRCLSAIIRQDGFEELCIKKNKEQSEKLCNLVRRHKQLVKKLTHHSNNKNIIKKKTKNFNRRIFSFNSYFNCSITCFNFYNKQKCLSQI